jgi:hypothetical protein
MKAFVVSLNGQPFLTAGVGDDGVVAASVTWVGGSPPRSTEGQLKLCVGGIDGRSREHIQWSVPEIAVGDEITIRIIESNQASPEDARYRPDMDRIREEIQRKVGPGDHGPDA